MLRNSCTDPYLFEELYYMELFIKNIQNFSSQFIASIHHAWAREFQSFVIYVCAEIFFFSFQNYK